MKRNVKMNAPRCSITTAAVLLGLLLLGLCITGLWMEEHLYSPEIRGELSAPEASPPFLEQDDVSYQLREDLTSILLLGFGSNSDPHLHLNLVVLDHTAQTIQRIVLDSDFILPTQNGAEADSCLHRVFPRESIDDFHKETCDLVCSAVSELLNGITPDCYIAAKLSDLPSDADWGELLADAKSGALSDRVPLILSCSKGYLFRQANRVRAYHRITTLTLSGNVRTAPDGCRYVVPEPDSMMELLVTVFCRKNA